MNLGFLCRQRTGRGKQERSGAGGAHITILLGASGQLLPVCWVTSAGTDLFASETSKLGNSGALWLGN